MQRPFRYSLLYDGECPVCLGSVGRLRRMDRGNRFEYLPIKDEEVEARFPGLSPQALNGSLHLVGPSGEVWEGADAVEKIISLLPGYGWIGRLFRIPLVRPTARWVYRWVARNRYRLSCGEHCSGDS